MYKNQIYGLTFFLSGEILVISLDVSVSVSFLTIFMVEPNEKHKTAKLTILRCHDNAIEIRFLPRFNLDRVCSNRSGSGNVVSNYKMFCLKP